MNIEQIDEQQQVTKENTSEQLAHCFSAIWLSEIALQLAITNLHLKRFYNLVLIERKKESN